MPGDATNQNGNGGEPNGNEALYDFHEDPIKDLVNEGDHDELGGEGEGEDGDKGDKGDKGNDAPISPALQAQLDKINERLAESDQIISYQRGQINILENQDRGGKDTPPPTPEPLLKVDKEAITKALGDPETAAENIVQLFEQFGENILKRVNKVNEDTANQFRARDANERWRADMLMDRKEAIDEFGEDVLNTKEFIAEADKELEKVLSARGSKSIYDMRRGDFIGVASRVYNRWLRSGKIAINGDKGNGNGNGNGNSQTRRQAPRTIRELNNELNASDRPAGGGGRPAGGGGGGGGGLTWESMYPNERERKIAQNAARKMGVSAEKWLKGYAANQAEDESYGR